MRGGVRILRAPVTEEPAPSEKAALHPEAKERIARAALALVRPGSAVGIGGGTTTLALARLLADVPDITIVTNSLPVALALPDHDSLVMIANRAAASIGLDQLFLGAHGIDADRGCTAPSLAEAETNRALMAATRETVAMIDASKWGVQGLAAFADLGELDTLVTDASLPHAQTREVRRTIGRVLLA